MSILARIFLKKIAVTFPHFDPLYSSSSTFVNVNKNSDRGIFGHPQKKVFLQSAQRASFMNFQHNLFWWQFKNLNTALTHSISFAFSIISVLWTTRLVSFWSKCFNWNIFINLKFLPSSMFWMERQLQLKLLRTSDVGIGLAYVWQFILGEEIFIDISIMGSSLSY